MGFIFVAVGAASRHKWFLSRQPRGHVA